MRFAGMMRVKNEARWIDRSIRSLLPLCSHIYILDDHSTDATFEHASRYEQVNLFHSPFDTFSETRDKQWLLEQIISTGTHYDYVVAIDGDEELEPEGPRKIRELVYHGKVQSALFKIIYLWDSPNQWRTDGIYGRFRRASLFKLDPKHTQYHSLEGDAISLHCTNVPWAMIHTAVDTDIQLLHWGYYDRELRMRKYEFYNRIDPGNTFEDQYRHMVIGDVFPADSRFRHAGPLKVEPLAVR